MFLARRPNRTSVSGNLAAHESNKAQNTHCRLCCPCPAPLFLLALAAPRRSTQPRTAARCPPRATSGPPPLRSPATGADGRHLASFRPRHLPHSGRLAPFPFPSPSPLAPRVPARRSPPPVTPGRHLSICSTEHPLGSGDRPSSARQLQAR